MSVTEKLLRELNDARGIVYPQVGYCFFADIKGDGRNIKKVYSVVNENGGAVYSNLNASTPRERCQRIRKALSEVA